MSHSEPTKLHRRSKKLPPYIQITNKKSVSGITGPDQTKLRKNGNEMREILKRHGRRVVRTFSLCRPGGEKTFASWEKSRQVSRDGGMFRIPPPQHQTPALRDRWETGNGILSANPPTPMPSASSAQTFLQWKQFLSCVISRSHSNLLDHGKGTPGFVQ